MWVPGDPEKETAPYFEVSNKVGEDGIKPKPEIVETKWVQHYWNEEFIAMLKICKHQWVPVVAGANKNELAPFHLDFSGLKLKFQQGNQAFCLFFSKEHASNQRDCISNGY